MARPRGKRNAVRLSIGFDERTYGALTAMAERNDTTVAWVIRRAVSIFIEGSSVADEPELPLTRTNKNRDNVQ